MYADITRRRGRWGGDQGRSLARVEREESYLKLYSFRKLTKVVARLELGGREIYLVGSFREGSDIVFLIVEYMIHQSGHQSSKLEVHKDLAWANCSKVWDFGEIIRGEADIGSEQIALDWVGGL